MTPIEPRSRAPGEPTATPRLVLLGRPTLTTAGGRRIALPRKAFALAARLVLDPSGGPLPRERAARFLWGDADPARRMGNLRQLLARLRELQTAEGPRLFAIDPDHVAFDADAARVDVVELMEAPGDLPLVDLVALARAHAGELLAGHDDGGDEQLRWLRQQRNVVRERFVALAAARAEGAVGVLSPEDATLLARRVLEADPTNEAGHRALIRVNVALGQYDTAARIHRRLVDVLREAGETPDITTALLGDDLVRRAREGTPVRFESTAYDDLPPVPRPVRQQRQPEIVVRVAGVEALGREERGLIEAVVEEATLRLWRSRSFVVTRRDDEGGSAVLPGTSSRYAATLRLVEADGRRRLAVSVQNLADGELLWVHRFDADDPAGRIARDLVVGCVYEIEQAELRLLAAAPDSPTVFRLTLQGNRLLREIDLPSIRRARATFRSALALDGDHAQTLAGLSKAYRLEWLLLARADDAELDQAMDHARRSIALAPDGSHGLHQLGICNIYKKNHELGLSLLRQSERQNPYDEELIGDHADALIVSGYAEEGIAKILPLVEDRVVPSDHALWILASGQYLTGRYDEALATLERLSSGEPAYQLIAACHAMRGDTEQAALFTRKLREILPDFNVSKRMKLVPLRRREDIEHYEEGLRRAGLE